MFCPVVLGCDLLTDLFNILNSKINFFIFILRRIAVTDQTEKLTFCFGVNGQVVMGSMFLG